MTQATKPFNLWYQQTIDDFEQELILNLDCRDIWPSRLREAMAYSLTNGGKRLRPLLVYATAECLNLDRRIATLLALSIEYIHTYSLVHDDLPSMDNDDWRRHKPSCHIAYDESTAILVGNALQAKAFEWLCDLPLATDISLQLVKELSHTIGASGIAQGQSLDLTWNQQQKQSAQLYQLRTMHHKKTGVLFELCVKFVLIASQQLLAYQSLVNFAQQIGIAFQIHDDILDTKAEQADTQQASDLVNNKLTYPSLLGLEQASQQLNQHYQQALQELNQTKLDTSRLAQLSRHMLKIP